EGREVLQPLLVGDRRRVVEHDDVVGVEVGHDLPPDRGRVDPGGGEEVRQPARVVADDGDGGGSNELDVDLGDRPAADLHVRDLGRQVALGRDLHRVGAGVDVGDDVAVVGPGG